MEPEISMGVFHTQPNDLQMQYDRMERLLMMRIESDACRWRIQKKWFGI